MSDEEREKMERRLSELEEKVRFLESKVEKLEEDENYRQEPW